MISKPIKKNLYQILHCLFRFWAGFLLFRVSLVHYNLYKLLKHDFGFFGGAFLDSFPFKADSPLLTPVIGWKFRFLDPFLVSTILI